MTIEQASPASSNFRFSTIGSEDSQGAHLFWGHGWGQSSAAFKPIAESLSGLYKSTLIDFPGFGGAPVPPDSWGTAEIADGLAQKIGSTGKTRIWIGHSFGCRIGLQLAARHPDLFHGMVLISAAGIPRHRTIKQKIVLKSRMTIFKVVRRLLPEGRILERLRTYFGSTDYRNAGPLRTLFVRVVRENLTEIARKVFCKTLLIYGQDDTETPPEIGARLNGLIQDSRFVVLDGYDHNSILTVGRHQLANKIHAFVKEIKV